MWYYRQHNEEFASNKTQSHHKVTWWQQCQNKNIRSYVIQVMIMNYGATKYATKDWHLLYNQHKHQLHAAAPIAPIVTIVPIVPTVTTACNITIVTYSVLTLHSSPYHIRGTVCSPSCCYGDQSRTPCMSCCPYSSRCSYMASLCLRSECNYSCSYSPQ